jgi:hypothetical protein
MSDQHQSAGREAAADRGRVASRAAGRVELTAAELRRLAVMLRRARRATANIAPNPDPAEER